MPGYNVVPQHIVNVLARALSTNPNTGAIVAEQLLRDDRGGDLIQKIVAGGELTAQDKAQLPTLMPGYSWETIGRQLRTGVTTLEDAMARIDQLEQQVGAPRSEVPQ